MQNSTSNKSRTNKLKHIIWTLVVIGIIYFVTKFIKQMNLSRQLKQISINCDNVPKSQTIFVSLVCLYDVQLCAQTIYSLFKMAYCPYRICIGVYQNLTHTNDFHFCCKKEYKRLCDENNSIDFSKNIRLYKEANNNVGRIHAKSDLCARSIIQNNLYKNEQYYLITVEGISFIHDWDRLCINLFQQNAEKFIKRTSNDSSSYYYPFIITEKITSPYINKNQQIIYNESNNNIVKIPPRFTSIVGWNINNIPELGLRYMADVAIKSFDTLIWSSEFSFCESSLINNIPFDPYMYVRRNDAEWIHGIRLWTHGIDFILPTQSFISSSYLTLNSDNSSNRFDMDYTKGYIRLKTLLRIINYDPKQRYSCLKNIEYYDLGLIRNISEYQKKIGANWQTMHIERHAKFGLMQIFTSDEIMCKYGSWSNLYQIMYQQ